jgi:N-acetylneuraminic acid mutarotase
LISRRTFLALGFGAVLACGGDEDAGPTPVPNVQQEPAARPAPGTATWSSRAPLPTPRSEVASAVLDGKIYIVGGFVASGQSSNIVEVYDPATDRWERKAPLPEARDHAMAAAFDRKLHIFGGGLGAATRTAFEYDPATDRWTRRRDMPFARTSGGAVPAFGTFILIAGGTGDSPQEMMLYDPAKDDWRTSARMTAPREHLAVVGLQERAYVIGGRWQNDLKDTNEVIAVNTGPWQTLAPVPTARGGTSAGVVNGRIYVAGGEAFGPSRTFPQVEAYDPAANTWSRMPDLPTPRHGLAVQGVGNVLYVIGGGPTAGLSVAPQNEALIIG